MNTALVVAAEESTHSPILPSTPDLIWGTICFVIVLVVVLKAALPQMNAMLAARKDAIEGELARAAETKQRAEAALEQYTAQLSDARREAGEIRDAARADGAKIVAEAREIGATEAARISANAHSQIEAERLSALSSLKTEVGTLALDLAGGVIGESLSDDTKAQAVVDRFLAELEAAPAGKTQES
ncbi:F0F1 ATP synthase subunit B [Microbacterium sp.]|uniref:F0F1 ATP synthase subunit B n=1 Tax=Microbacterium sp. TaxID=51671 RepID=UPI0039E24318